MLVDLEIKNIVKDHSGRVDEAGGDHKAEPTARRTQTAMHQKERGRGIGDDRENIGDAEESQVREHCRKSFREVVVKLHSMGSKLQGETGGRFGYGPFKIESGRR